MTAVASARQHAQWPMRGWPAVLLRVAGAGLLIATAAIHLDLYLTGYRTIPVIGWLFLLQVIAAFGLGLAVLALPGRLFRADRLAAAAGAASRSARISRPGRASTASPRPNAAITSSRNSQPITGIVR